MQSTKQQAQIPYVFYVNSNKARLIRHQSNIKKVDLKIKYSYSSSNQLQDKVNKTKIIIKML